MKPTKRCCLGTANQRRHCKTQNLSRGRWGLWSAYNQLANQLAYLLPLDAEQKLQLLEIHDVQLRLELLQQLLELLQGERQ